MSYPFSITDVEDAASALQHIPDPTPRNTLRRILCGARFMPLVADDEPNIDWNAQPSWARYAAMDEDGGWWVYNAEVEPDREDGVWTTPDVDGFDFERMTNPPEDWIGDWCCSRRVRPGTEEYDREMD